MQQADKEQVVIAADGSEVLQMQGWGATRLVWPLIGTLYNTKQGPILQICRQ